MPLRWTIATLCYLTAGLFFACELEPSEVVDARPDDANLPDYAAPDGPIPDAPAPHPPIPDGAAPDAAVSDLTPADQGPPDALPPDVKPADAFSPDALTWLKSVTCASTPPAGAKLAAALPKYKGTCPTLKAGANTITSSGNKRKFVLVLPKKIKAGESLPVLFMWHWLAGSAASFSQKGEVQKAADAQRFIAVIPDSKGDIAFIGKISFPWPFLTILTDKRMEEEHELFDDALACVGAQYKVNKECVAAAGVSAGALYASHLARSRSGHISSLVSLSGGLGSSGGISNYFVRTWKKKPAHRFPSLVLWGGAQDSCGLVNFAVASQTLEKSLAAGGHFFVECIHNCKHAEPPVTPLAGQSRYESIWEFVLQHPFWLADGQSPLQLSGWPKTPIPWCGLGKGSATPRTGTCPPPACPF